MIDLQISREEQTPEGTVSLDCVIGIQPDSSPLLARHLLAELDIAAWSIAGLIDANHVLARDTVLVGFPPEQVRADLVTERIQKEQAASERQRYGIREVENCGIHDGAPSHICGKLCPPCKQCTTRTRLKIDERGELIEVKP